MAGHKKNSEFGAKHKKEDSEEGCSYKKGRGSPAEKKELQGMTGNVKNIPENEEAKMREQLTE